MSKEVKKGVEPSFLSNVFHELLTPINVILGFIQEINDSIDKPTEDQKEAIDIIKENQKLLLQSMDTAAEYSALEDNKIKFKPEEIFFVDLLEEIQTTTERTARSNNLELTYGKISSSLKLTTDKHHFSILVTQFIKYAMQISDESKLYLSAYSYEDDKCLISVKDRREGVSSKLMEGLEEIFTKDEDALRKNFGFSRITTKLFRKLIVFSNARNEIITRDGKPIEYGIILSCCFRN
ncbi:MAG: HAMP domain-containing sensor histidine kinase [Melioribacteraceae bacterium]|nr:HAMP domain-containing sensor histidine kinase [Melioribacteraceae bacterium]